MDRRRLLIGAEVLLSLVSLALAVNAFLPHPSVTAIFVLAALASAATGFTDRRSKRCRPASSIATSCPRPRPSRDCGDPGRRRRSGDRRHLRRPLRNRGDVPDRRRDVRRLAGRARAHGGHARGARSREARPPQHRRGPRLRTPPARADRDVRHRHRRDDVRDADRAVPCARPAMGRRDAAGSLYAAMPFGSFVTIVFSGWAQEGLAARRRGGARGGRLGRRHRGARTRRRPGAGARLPRPRRCGRRGERSLPDDDLERDDPDAPARPPARASR